MKTVSIANPLKTTIENLFSSEASCTLDEVVIKKDYFTRENATI
jgi:hypothetical protein